MITVDGSTDPDRRVTIAKHAVARGATTEQAATTKFRDVFAVGEFRALWLAQLLSVAGDQLARVALTILVYDRTHSAFLAAVTFVTSIVPTFIGGLTLAWLADRLPRRTVMIACDLVRCALLLLMAVPGVPLAVLVVLLFTVTLAGAPFTAARAAVYPDVLTGDRYVVGTAVTLTTNQLAQVIGFAAGGAIVGLFGTRTSLVADAATFAGSAVLITALVRRRPLPGAARGSKQVRHGRPLDAVRLVFGTAALRTPLLFGWLMAFYDAPEGVSAPLAHRLGGGAVTLGMLLAAQTLGVSIGSLVFGRAVPPHWQRRVLGVLATATCATLMLFALAPRLAGSMLILGSSGALSCYQLAANASFVQATPDECRSGAFGLAQGGISLGQGVMMLLAGAAAQRIAPATVIAACGVVGTAVAVALTASASAGLRHGSSQEIAGLPGPTWLSFRLSGSRATRATLSGPATGAHARHLLSSCTSAQRPLY